MIPIHRIRLAGPWDFSLSLDDGTERTVRQSLDAPLSSAGEILAKGELRISRRFNRPTGLDENSSVWLMGQGWPAAGHVAFNQVDLGLIDENFRYEVASFLIPGQNQVTFFWPGSQFPSWFGTARLALEIQRLGD